MIIPAVLASRRRAVAPPAGNDPHWANVVSLLHFNGQDGSTTITDETGRIWAVDGSTAQIRTANSRFGGASLYVQSSGRASAQESTDFDFGTGDFTLEAHAYQSVGATSGDRFILCRQIDSPAGIALQLRLSSGVPQLVLRGKSGGAVVEISGASALPPGQFYSIAARRVSGVVELYVNYQRVASAACAFDMTAATPRGFIVGASDGNNPGSIGQFSGYIDEVRITKGVARDLTIQQTAEFPRQ